MKNLSEAKAGIIALNVVSDENFLEINGVRIERKEYRGVPVLTSWDIAKIHGKEIRRINENFKNVKEKLVLVEDYLVLTRKEISESKISIQEKIPNNVKSIYLFTEMGYLMLSKTFSDDFSWQIQRELIKNYFKLKKLKNAVENGEVSIAPKISREDELVLNIAKARNNAEIAAEFAKYRNEIVEPLRKDAQRYRKYLDKNGTIRATDIAGMLGTTPAFVNLVMNYVGVIVRDGKGWKPQKEWGGKGIMKLIETSYFVKRSAQDSQALNTAAENEKENGQQLLPFQSADKLMPAVQETGKKEVDKVEFRYTIEGAELVEKVFLGSGLAIKDENGNFSEDKKLAKIMRSEYNNFKQTGKRSFKVVDNIIQFIETIQ